MKIYKIGIVKCFVQIRFSNVLFGKVLEISCFKEGRFIKVNWHPIETVKKQY